MNWFHCNRCGSSKEGGPRPFVLTSCGHIFCQRCIQSADCQSGCLVCKSSHMKWEEINPEMLSKPEVGLYFKLRLHLMKMALRGMEFQLSHFKGLVQILSSIKSESIERLAEAKAKRNELEEMLQVERRWLKEAEENQLRLLKTPGKPKDHPASFFRKDNSSWVSDCSMRSSQYDQASMNALVRRWEVNPVIRKNSSNFTPSR